MHHEKNRRLTPHVEGQFSVAPREATDRLTPLYRGSSPSPREATEDSLHIQRQFIITTRSNRRLTPHTEAVHHHHEKQQKTHSTYRGSSSSPREAIEDSLHI